MDSRRGFILSMLVICLCLELQKYDFIVREILFSIKPSLIIKDLISFVVPWNYSGIKRAA